MPVGTVSVRDALSNVVSAGTYSVTFSHLTGASTVLVTPGQKYTSGGYAYFTLQASGGIGTDTYGPVLTSGSLPGANTTCSVLVSY